MADDGITDKPCVLCMYYHSKQGAAHMDFYDKHHGKALRYWGNECVEEGGWLEVFPE